MIHCALLTPVGDSTRNRRCYNHRVMIDGVPLREVLKLAPLENARVVGGAAGLGRRVRNVNVMEVPDIVAWVKPDQLLLTTTYPLRDERAVLESLVPRLAEQGLAGFAIKPARYLDEIPSTMIAAANALGFPLIQLPLETSFDDVINAVLGVILNAQAMRLERSETIHRRFTRIALAGGGLREIAAALAELVAHPVGIVRPDGALLAKSPGFDLSVLSLDRFTRQIETVEDPPGPQWVRIVSEDGADVGVVQPIRVSGDVYGAVVVRAGPGTLGEAELIALEHATTVAALRIVQERAIAAADSRFQVVCLEELVNGHFRDRGRLLEHAVTFGWDLAVPRAALVVEIESGSVGGAPGVSSYSTSQRCSRVLAEAAGAALGRRAIVWERSFGIAALVVADPSRPGQLKESAAEIQREMCRRWPEILVSIGVGRVCEDPLELAASHAEASRALAVGKRTRKPGQIWLFRELGLDRLLVSCPELELSEFCEQTIGILVAYDAAHQTNLVQTLETFLTCNRNGVHAARSLYVHYNTLKHRLDRIEAILGPFVDDLDRCLSLSLALRARRLRN